MPNQFELDSIRDWAEEAIMQLDFSLENSQVAKYANPLIELITTTESWGKTEYEKADSLMIMLAPYRNLSETYEK